MFTSGYCRPAPVCVGREGFLSDPGHTSGSLWPFTHFNLRDLFTSKRDGRVDTMGEGVRL